jgi:hypothetical protein
MRNRTPSKHAWTSIARYAYDMCQHQPRPHRTATACVQVVCCPRVPHTCTHQLHTPKPTFNTLRMLPHARTSYRKPHTRLSGSSRSSVPLSASTTPALLQVLVKPGHVLSTGSSHTSSMPPGAQLARLSRDARLAPLNSGCVPGV